jgi:hypothetical protein
MDFSMDFMGFPQYSLQRYPNLRIADLWLKNTYSSALNTKSSNSKASEAFYSSSPFKL